MTILYDDRGLVMDRTEPFLREYNNIGIMSSGGTDSSFVLWWLAKCINDLNLCDSHTLLPIHGFDLSFSFNTTPYFLKIVKVIRDFYPKVNILDPYIIKYRDKYEINRDNAWGIRTRKSEYLRPVVKKLEKGLIDVSIGALTSAPLFEKVDFGSITRERNFKEKSKIKKGFLINVDKKFLAYQYRKFNLMNTLFPLTKSCVTPDKKGNACKRCDWCKEKYWAFDCYDGGVK